MSPSGKTTRKLRSGSPSTGGPEYLVVGFLRRAHGLRGDMLMDVVTDFPERLRANAAVFLGPDHRPAVIERVRPVSRGILVKFRGTDTLEAAAALGKDTVFVDSGDRPELAKGHYYHHQILGIDVVDELDRPVGALTEILQTGANDVYVVKQAGGHEVLLPAIASVILHVDLAKRTMQVRLPQVLGQNGQP